MRGVLRQAGRLLALSHNPPDPTLARPSHFIAVEGAEILDFYVDYRNIGLSEVRGRFGPGKRLNITGFGVTPDGILIEKTMVVELYEAYPDTAMIWAVYRNKDLERPLRITRIINQFFRMDASLTDPQAPRHALQCFHHDRLVHGQATRPCSTRLRPDRDCRFPRIRPGGLLEPHHGNDRGPACPRGGDAHHPGAGPPATSGSRSRSTTTWIGYWSPRRSLSAPRALSWSIQEITARGWPARKPMMGGEG